AKVEGRPLRSFLDYLGAGAVAGAGAGAAFAGGVGAAGPGTACCSGDGVGPDGCVSGERPPSTEPGPRLPTIPSASAPTMNRMAQIVVARDSTVAPLRAPNAA